jgi:hypothetical protein
MSSSLYYSIVPLGLSLVQHVRLWWASTPKVDHKRGLYIEVPSRNLRVGVVLQTRDRVTIPLREGVVLLHSCGPPALMLCAEEVLSPSSHVTC